MDGVEWSAIINMLRIIKEPTAVAIAYELDQPCAGESNVLRILFCFVLLVVVLFSVCFLSDPFNVCQL